MRKPRSEKASVNSGFRRCLSSAASRKVLGEKDARMKSLSPGVSQSETKRDKESEGYLGVTGL